MTWKIGLGSEIVNSIFIHWFFYMKYIFIFKAGFLSNIYFLKIIVSNCAALIWEFDLAAIRSP